MFRACLLAPVLIAAAALAACGGGEPAGGVAGAATVRDTARAADAFATPGELAWIRRFSAWAQRFALHGDSLAAYEAADGELELGRYERLLEPIRACEDGFLERVGRAPTARLRQAERSLVAACRLFRGGVDQLLEAMRSGDRGLAQRARYRIEDGSVKFSVAAGLLPPGEKQRLPVAGGETGRSRIDPRYGEIASSAAEKRVEARCWSKRDWQRLLVEEQALTGGRLGEGLIAFASAGGERVHLGPFVCRHLDALVYRGARPRRPERQLALAQALGALVHESRHTAGVADEPTTECQALQRLAAAAEAAGVEPAYTRALVRVAWESYPLLPPDYRSRECRPGGDLDESPGDGRFP